MQRSCLRLEGTIGWVEGPHHRARELRKSLLSSLLRPSAGAAALALAACTRQKNPNQLQNVRLPPAPRPPTHAQVTLSGSSEWITSTEVVGSSTLELTLAQFWSSAGDSSLEAVRAAGHTCTGLSLGFGVHRACFWALLAGG